MTTGNLFHSSSEMPRGHLRQITATLANYCVLHTDIEGAITTEFNRISSPEP